jgi:hypothetical protein
MAKYARGSARDIELREKQARCVELRKAGWTLDAIARHPLVQYSDHRAVKKAIDAYMRRNEAEGSEELRQFENERLNDILKSIWPRVKQGDVNAIDRALRVIDVRMKLLGLSKPALNATIDPTKMSDDELDAMIKKFAG